MFYLLQRFSAVKFLSYQDQIAVETLHRYKSHE